MTLKTLYYAEANNQAEQDAAFAEGAIMVIRLDLLPDVIPPLQPDEPILHLEFNDFTDSSTRNHVVTKVGNPTLSGGVIDCSGQGNYLTVSGIDVQQNWTIECWYQMKLPSNGTSHSFICSKGLPGDLNNSWYIAILAGGFLAVSDYNNRCQAYVPYPHKNDIDHGHHLSFNSDDGHLTIYIDGQLFFESSIALIQNTGNFYVGGWNYATANVHSDYIVDFVIYPFTKRTGNFNALPV